MQTTVSSHITPLKLLKRFWRVNAPLTIVSGVMCVVFVLTLVGVFMDTRVITGTRAWIKPSKFALSFAIYAFTLLWLLSLVQGHTRLVKLIAQGTALTAVVEVGIIVLQAARGTTSHYNNSSALNTALWATMGVAILLVWGMNLVALILLVRQRLPDQTLASGIRWGLTVSFIGMSVGLLMFRLIPSHQSVIPTFTGAHNIGVADGGPGLPFLNWSTVGGDFRIPHFLGLHGLQALPMIGWLISIYGARMSKRHQGMLVWTSGFAYLGLIVLLSWQALRGESIIAPDALTGASFAILLLVTLSTSLVIVWRAGKQSRAPQLPTYGRGVEHDQ